MPFKCESERDHYLEAFRWAGPLPSSGCRR
jgi:hypothetical protein